MAAVLRTNPAYITTPGHTAKCELDMHADTCVAGANFFLEELTGETADVVPYNDGYAPKKDVPIAMALTAWTCPQTGKTFILVFHQVLWFGNEMAVSLLNLNQMHFNGLSVCNDVMDPHHDFGIEMEDDRFLDFDMHGTTVFFETHVPTDQEWDTCWHIVMTSDVPWDPISVTIGLMR